jgi:hypothetical protein
MLIQQAVEEFRIPGVVCSLHLVGVVLEFISMFSLQVKIVTNLTEYRR